MTLNTIVEFSKKNMEFFILAVYAYVLFQIEDNDYVTMLLLTVAACLSICFLKKRNVVEGARCSGGDSGGDSGGACGGVCGCVLHGS